MSDYDHTSRTVIDEYKKKPKTDWGTIFGGAFIIFLILSAFFGGK